MRGLGFGELRFDDWSDQLAPTYTHLKGRLEQLRERMLSSMGEAHYEELRARMDNWISSGRDRRIGYGLFDGRATVPASAPGRRG